MLQANHRTLAGKKRFSARVHDSERPDLQQEKGARLAKGSGQGRIFRGILMADGKRKKVLSMAWALAMYYSQKNFAVSREVGLPYLDQAKKHYWTKQRADFIAVNKNQDVVIVETKSCWSDFATDHKWQGYLQHCTKFYFGADTETAKRIAEYLKSVPDAKGIGVIAFEPEESGLLVMKFLVPVACMTPSSARTSAPFCDDLSKLSIHKKTIRVIFLCMASCVAFSEKLQKTEKNQ